MRRFFRDPHNESWKVSYCPGCRQEVLAQLSNGVFLKCCVLSCQNYVHAHVDPHKVTTIAIGGWYNETGNYFNNYWKLLNDSRRKILSSMNPES